MHCYCTYSTHTAPLPINVLFSLQHALHILYKISTLVEKVLNLFFESSQNKNTLLLHGLCASVPLRAEPHAAEEVN